MLCLSLRFQMPGLTFKYGRHLRYMTFTCTKLIISVAFLSTKESSGSAHRVNGLIIFFHFLIFYCTNVLLVFPSQTVSIMNKKYLIKGKILGIPRMDNLIDYYQITITTNKKSQSMKNVRNVHNEYIKSTPIHEINIRIFTCIRTTFIFKSKLFFESY